jgi:hypothetical protein
MRVLKMKHLVAAGVAALTMTITATAIPASAATRPAVPGRSASVTQVAEFIKTADPALRESVPEIAAHVSAVQRDLRQMEAVQVTDEMPVFRGLIPHISLISHWGNTWYFSRYDVAWMAALSTAAFVAVLVYTCGITVAAAWGMVGVVIGVFWGAFWAGRCAYLTPHPFHTGSYSC